ncbi:MAG: pyridoxal phosphate-dependent aminotransferase [Tissierellales bacterium]|nr:pyridoxal phosphate-dependent aminotransferase [Tissierellales bacterium]MBN2827795.1 pyridoxal phosphate-dependent aminotransferase [Tissierellales bacterium]
MKYNFEDIVNRHNTNSLKWEPEILEEMFGEPQMLPFWVADMDFKTAQPIIDAVVKKALHGIYGYSIRPNSYYEAIIDWTKQYFGWEIKKEWIAYVPGVVPAINYAIQAFCEEGDKVLIQEPVYYPFAKSILNNERVVVSNDLYYNGEHYEIDFADFEEKARDPRIKIFIMSSPHNPISRVWTKEELIKIGRLCIDNEVLIVSDEIHNDLVFKGYKHTMFASISEEFAQHSITCTAPSKTFNLAGLQSSNIIIPNESIRERYAKILTQNNINMQNPLSISAVEAAYRHGRDWLDQLLDYLTINKQFMSTYLSQHLPDAKIIETQATYLAWVDLRAYEKNGKILEERIAKKGKVAFDGGTWFGENGNGFIRINFACPRQLLMKGLEGLCQALNQ